MTTHADLIARADHVAAVAGLTAHTARNTPTNHDPATIAYAAAEISNATQRLRMALTQLETP